MSVEPRILIVFHSAEGQTAKIAERIAGRIRRTGAFVEVHESSDAPDPTGFDGVVLGDSIHMQRHSRALESYVKRHGASIRAVPSAVFQVSMTSADHDEEHDRVARGYLEEFLGHAHLDPDVVGLFAGALAYTRYGWVKRKAMQKIAEADGQPTDPTHDVEFTDWDDVDDFANDFATVVAIEHRAAASP